MSCTHFIRPISYFNTILKCNYNARFTKIRNRLRQMKRIWPYAPKRLTHNAQKNISIFNKILKSTGLIVFYKAMPLQQRLHSLGHWSLIVTALTRSWSVVQILGGVQTLAILNTSTSTSILVLLLILLKLLLLLLLLILPGLKVLLLLLFALPLYLLGEGEQRLL